MFLFLAIDFSNQIKGELGEIAESLSARSVSGNFTQRDNFHITLAFIGETDAKKVPLITDVMDSVKTAPFEIELVGIGKFGNRGGDIWWYGVQMNPMLKELNQYISDELRKHGFNIESRSYKPHITLGREVFLAQDFKKNDFERSMPRINVPVNRISLMKSERIGGKIKYIEVYGKQL